MREAVRFGDGVGVLCERGVGTFLEVGPGGVLSGMVRGVLADGVDVSVVPVMRGDRSEGRALVGALAGLFVRGVVVDWSAYFAGVGGRRVDLPTYAFQRERYWPTLTARLGGNAAGLGLSSADHPLLGAAVVLADGEGVVLTGRLSLSTHAWLADHRIMGSVLLPGTAFVELAMRAAAEVRCAGIAELVLESPLVLTESEAVQIQVRVGGPDDSGVRAVGIYSALESNRGDVRRRGSGLVASCYRNARAGRSGTAARRPVWRCGRRRVRRSLRLMVCMGVLRVVVLCMVRCFGGCGGCGVGVMMCLRRWCCRLVVVGGLVFIRRCWMRRCILLRLVGCWVRWGLGLVGCRFRGLVCRCLGWVGRCCGCGCRGLGCLGCRWWWRMGVGFWWRRWVRW